MLRRYMIGLLAGLLVTGCALPTVDKEADAKARELYEQIRTGADLGQSPDLAPDLKTPANLAQLAAIRDMLPPGDPTAAVNRSWNFNAGTGGTTATLVHAYSYPTQTVLAQTVLAKGKGGAWLVTGFHVSFEASGPAPSPGAVTVTRPPQPT